MDETADDSLLDDVETPWDNVEEVSYEFIKTGKSKGDGILLTHDSTYNFLADSERKTIEIRVSSD